MVVKNPTNYRSKQL